MQKLRVGLLNDSTHFAPELAHLVEWARGRDDIEITHLVLHPQSGGAEAEPGAMARILAASRRHGLRGTLSRITFRALSSVETEVLHRTTGEAAAEVDLAALVPQTLVLPPEVSPSGYVYRFGSDQLEQIRRAGIDVLIRCGSGIFKGGILTVAPFGILSFHHGDNRINRGGPPGFWEVRHRWPSTGFVLQQLTEELDGGRALRRGSYPTQLYYAANRRSITRWSDHHLRDVLAHLAEHRQLPAEIAPEPYSGPLLRTPGLGDQLAYAGRQVSLLGGRGLRKLVGQRTSWAVGYVRSPWRRAVLRRSRELPTPPRTFLADPFVVEQAGGHFCFVEEYSFDTRRGVIAVYRLDSTPAERVGVALETDFHLSFPYLFRYGGELYMCPETLGAGDIRLYRCVDFPLRWELDRVVLPGVQAVDTVIFDLDDRWWLLTTMDPSGQGNPASELYAFSADSPLTDTWVPHPDNPLRIDTEARNGGFLEEDGTRFRVTQRQGFAVYGAGAAIRRIVSLDEHGLVEEPVSELRPDFKPGIHGVHHVHSDGTFTVFDYARKRRVR